MKQGYMKIKNIIIGMLSELTTSFAESSVRDKIDSALRGYFYTDKIDGEECYVFKTVIGVSGWSYYIKKTDGTLVRISSGNVEDTEMKISDFKYSFGSVADEEMIRPDLTGYEIITNQ